MERPEEVLAAVRDAIAGEDRFKGEFEVTTEGMRREGEWWFVPVTLSEIPAVRRRMELYARFAELESYLQTTKNLQVLLVPVITAQTA